MNGGNPGYLHRAIKELQISAARIKLTDGGVSVSMKAIFSWQDVRMMV